MARATSFGWRPPPTGPPGGRSSSSTVRIGARRVDSITEISLDEVADRVASGHYRNGIRPEDPVAIFVEDSLRYLVHYVALTRLGAIPAFLNSRPDRGRRPEARAAGAAFDAKP